MIKRTLFLSCISSLLCVAQTPQYYTETFDDLWSQSFQVNSTIKEVQTDYQTITVFNNDQWGNVLSIDGVIQTTEKDEYIYHEMMAHPALFMHQNPKKVLIVGGGDGGVAREVLKHPAIERVDLVELDKGIVTASQKYFPTISDGAFQNPKLNLIFSDGSKYISGKENEYDVIIVDSTDPIGFGEKLFTAKFYSNCNKALTHGGYLICQNGCPFVQEDEFIDAHANRLEHFTASKYYLAPVPTYIGGFMAFGIARKGADFEEVNKKELLSRVEAFSGELKYYNAEIQSASFALPNCFKCLLED